MCCSFLLLVCLYIMSVLQVKQVINLRCNCFEAFTERAFKPSLQDLHFKKLRDFFKVKQSY